MKPQETDFEAQTVGQHVRKRRLLLELNQKEAGARLGVTPQTVLHWEKGQTKPPIESMPAILRFLGYDPLPEPKTLPERLLAKRRAMGWSIRKAAREFGIDPGTWGDWEHGELILFRKHRTRVAEFLGVDFKHLADEMRTRWNGKHRRWEGRES